MLFMLRLAPVEQYPSDQSVISEVMGADWQQTGEGMADLVARLPGVLTRLLGPEASWPRVIFSDRGPGFFVSSTGHIVKAYGKALKKYGFRTSRTRLLPAELALT